MYNKQEIQAAIVLKPAAAEPLLLSVLARFRQEVPRRRFVPLGDSALNHEIPAGTTDRHS